MTSIAQKTRRLPEPYRLTRVISAYNAATNPAVPRTDREHRSCRRIGRVAMAILQREYHEGKDWKESEHSGRIWRTSRD